VDAQVEISFAAILLAASLSAQVPLAGDILHRDDFRSGLDQWIAEMEKPGTITARAGVLNIDVPAGCTLWFKHQLSGPVMIQYDAKMIQAGGPNDRVSDLNCFWMATDASTRRSGKFSDYDELRTYYVGQGQFQHDDPIPPLRRAPRRTSAATRARLASPRVSASPQPAATHPTGRVW